jgi:hypothetical protein
MVGIASALARAIHINERASILGYGHATRVSAFATHLLSLDQGHIVYIISSAPARVFADSIAAGAQYRTADIDPIIVQPLA